MGSVTIRFKVAVGGNNQAIISSQADKDGKYAYSIEEAICDCDLPAPIRVYAFEMELPAAVENVAKVTVSVPESGGELNVTVAKVSG